MAQNGISYEGRVVATQTRPIKLTQSANGMIVLEITVAEQHSMKKSQAMKNPALAKLVEADDRNASKGADDFVNTTTSWHRLTIFGDKAEALALDENFNANALIVVDNASYSEEGDWETRDGVKRAGRPETIGDKKGSIEIKFPPRVKDGERPKPALWDGETALPKPGGNGGGQDREIREDEGF